MWLVMEGDKDEKEWEELILLKVRVMYVEQPFSFEVEVPDSTSLMELHHIIQETIGFDNDHLFEFFAGRSERNKKIVFGRDPDHWDIDLEVNGDIFLEDVYPLAKGYKLYYLFDYGDHWLFEITKQRKKPKFQEKVAYPRVITADGVKPEQYSNLE